VRRYVLVAVVLLFACTSNSSQPTGSRDRHAAPTTVAAPTTAPPPTPPAFDSAIAVIDEATAVRMTTSWRPGCPVPLSELRLLTLDHWGYDGVEHPGELVVHADQAEAVVTAFRTLFEAGFPIERMELVDEYGGDDAASTRANNTAGFNCRSVVGNPDAWSQHAYGRAVDVNPRVNPYVVDPNVRDAELARYLDRSLGERGMLQPDDAAVRAFAAIGWEWGGYWSSPDYQHFSATGR
jgi:hypothetical protein